MTPRGFALWLEGMARRLTAPAVAPAPDLARQVGAALVADMAGRFDAGVNLKGGRWPPLKHRKGKPLQDTGALLASALRLAGQARVESLEGGGLAVWVDPGLLVSYGRFQDEGTRTIPPRPFVGVSDAALDEVAGLYAAAAAAQAAGG